MASENDNPATPNRIRCHYEVLGVERDADAATVKRHHRKMALRYHPDKNLGNDQGAAAEMFRLVQQAYECLSDPQERKWYDDHRDAILAGWSTSAGGGDGTDARADMLFSVVPFMHPGCYSGYHSENGGFYQVYQHVFESIVAGERRQSETNVELPTDFGSTDSGWDLVRDFYQEWESFSSVLNFAWEDKFNVNEDAPNRRVRRLMEEENKKARKTAKKTYNSDILQLLAFVKRRDPRVKAKLAELEQSRKEQETRQRQSQMERKKEQQKAKEAWRESAMREMEKAEEEDRQAGRIRLADLEDDYDYGGAKKKKGKKKKTNKLYVEEDESNGEDSVAKAAEIDPSLPPTASDAGEKSDAVDAGDAVASTTSKENKSCMDQDNSDKDDEVGVMEHVVSDEFSEGDEDFTDSEDEPDVWRCECCRKDFKSEGQLVNHMKSKKHKEAFKKYDAKLKKQEEEIMTRMMEEVELAA